MTLAVRRERLYVPSRVASIALVRLYVAPSCADIVWKPQATTMFPGTCSYIAVWPVAQKVYAPCTGIQSLLIMCWLG